MPKINCNVSNCSHNNQGTCYSNRVDINGKKAHESTHTCCSAFLDAANYSTLTSNTNDSGPCSALICKVTTCSHNGNNLCNLDTISVSADSGRTNLYTETSCSSFECK